jgi:hypothetical protein
MLTNQSQFSTFLLGKSRDVELSKTLSRVVKTIGVGGCKTV